MDRPDPWEYIIENERRLRYLCVAGSRGRRYLVDDIWSDVVLDKVPRCIELWDCERPLWTYVSSSLKAYIWKYVNKYLSQAPMEDLRERYVVIENDTRLRVIELLERLSDQAREILYLKHFMSFTFEEIAVYYDISIGTAHSRYNVAVVEAQELGE